MDPEVGEGETNPNILAYQAAEDQPPGGAGYVRVDKAGQAEVRIDDPVDVGFLNCQWSMTRHVAPARRN